MTCLEVLIIPIGMKGKIKMATFATTSRIALLANLGITSYVLKIDGEVALTNDKVGNRIRVDVVLPNSTTVDFTKNYVLIVTLNNGDVLMANVSKTLLFGSTDFATQFHYDGDDLGAVYSVQETSFKVWSPLSSSISLRLYDNGTPASLGGSDTFTAYPMTKGDKGVFSLVVPGDLEGKYYTYVVSNGVYQDKECVDPYAKGCGVNGQRGMIVDFSKTNPTGWDDVSAIAIDRKALTVYETHVADVTSSATWTGLENNRKRFAGMQVEDEKEKQPESVVEEAETTSAPTPAPIAVEKHSRLEYSDLEYLKLSKWQRFLYHIARFFLGIPAWFKNAGITIWHFLKKCGLGVWHEIKDIGLTFVHAVLRSEDSAFSPLRRLIFIGAMGYPHRSFSSLLVFLCFPR